MSSWKQGSCLHGPLYAQCLVQDLEQSRDFMHPCWVWEWMLCGAYNARVGSGVLGLHLELIGTRGEIVKFRRKLLIMYIHNYNLVLLTNSLMHTFSKRSFTEQLVLWEDGVSSFFLGYLWSVFLVQIESSHSPLTFTLDAVVLEPVWTHIWSVRLGIQIETAVIFFKVHINDSDYYY